MHTGPFKFASPIVLTPMAGITSVAFRTLYREQELQRMGMISGLYVCEMITVQVLVERDGKTMHVTTFVPDENPRSLQFYTTDSKWTYEAAKVIADENLVDHIDMNSGYPVPKVTCRGGGPTLPCKHRLFSNVVTAAVKATEDMNIPATVKFRVGIDGEHHTHLDVGHIAAGMGAQTVTLYARTATQRYSGHAGWSQIMRLKGRMVDSSLSGIPVLGNGDIFASTDACKMLDETGCDGVVVSYDCLGRPWLFAQLPAGLRDEEVLPVSTFGEVTGVIRRHAKLLVEHRDERKGCRDLYKRIAWYLRGYPAGSGVRKSLVRVNPLAALDKILTLLHDGPNAHACPEDTDGVRGQQGPPAKVVLSKG